MLDLLDIPVERQEGKDRFIRVDDQMYAWCPRCSEYLTFDRFTKGAGRKYDLASWCKTCYLTDNRLRKYGVTAEYFDRMFGTQDGKCAICITDLSFTSAHVDHCHKTGKIRGLLCENCNRGIGLLNDSVENLLRAVDYLA